MKYLIIGFVIITSVMASEQRPDIAFTSQTVFFCNSGNSLSGAIYQPFCKKQRNLLTRGYIFFTQINEELLFHPQLIGQSPNGGLATIDRWCNWEINDGRLGPNCVLRVEHMSETNKKPVYLPLEFVGNSGNMISFDPTLLSRGVEYRGSLIETSSSAISQFFRIDLRF